VGIGGACRCSSVGSVNFGRTLNINVFFIHFSLGYLNKYNKNRESCLKKSKKVINTALVAAVWVLSGTASAALQNLEFVGTVTSKDSQLTNIDIGDQFSVTLTIDDSVTDTNSSIGAGTFPGLVTAFVAAANAGNSGSWSPSGTPDLPASNFVTNAFGNNVTFEVLATSNPEGGIGWAFLAYDIWFGWPPGVTDSGTGDTFAEQLGAPVSIPPASPTLAIQFTDVDSSASPSAVLTLIAPGPVPTTPVPVGPLWLLGIMAGLLSLVGIRKLRKA
jgi:hypothetical protein